jgi:hypothetical protein
VFDDAGLMVWMGKLGARTKIWGEANKRNDTPFRVTWSAGSERNFRFVRPQPHS